MKLKDILAVEHVIADLKAKTRDEALAELVAVVANEIPVPRKELLRVLVEREDQSPTAMSGGVAVPHGRIPGLPGFTAAVGRSLRGIAFGNQDGPTRLFFMIMAPAEDTVNHLKILARVARLCRRQDLLDRIRNAASAREIFECILEEDAQI